MKPLIKSNQQLQVDWIDFEREGLITVDNEPLNHQ